MTAEHSPIAPSDAARRIQCPASTTLQALYPEAGDDPAAVEGTAAHWAVAEQLSGRLVDVGQIAPNGVVLTVEMAEAADQVSDYVTALLAPHGLKPSDGHVEQRVAIPRVHPQSWGTPDYWIRTPGPHGLVVLDFKFGHRYVPAVENAQMVEYLAGITDDGTNDLMNDYPITAVIAQPRCYSGGGSIREWRTTRTGLRALINVSSTAAHEALGANPRARVGDECRDCRARHACPALQRAALSAMDEARHVVPLELPPAALSLELRMARRAQTLLEARVTGLEQQATVALKRGVAVPGWRVEHSAGREAWTVPADQVIAMGAMMGVDVAKPAAPITPEQARKAGLDPDVVAAVSKRPPGGAKLVEDDQAALKAIFAAGA